MAWLFSDSGAGPQAIRPLYETYIISVEHTVWVVSVLARLDVKIKKEFVTSHGKTFRTVSRFKTDSRSPAVHLPFERLVLSVLKNSSSVRTVRAIRSRKLISRSNGSSYPFEKNHRRSNGSSYPFEKFISRSNGSSYPFEKFISRSNSSSCPCKKKKWVFLAAIPTRQDFKTNRHALLNVACRYDYMIQTVVTFLFFVYLRLIFNKIISFSQLFPRKKIKRKPLVMVLH